MYHSLITHKTKKAMRYFLFLLSLISSLNVYAQNEVTYYETEKGEKHLLGIFDRSDLGEEPYLSWYNKVYARYEIDKNHLAKVK